MTEHEQLKAICDEIGYLMDEYNYGTDTGFYMTESQSEIYCEYTDRIIDVREIIFTPEFISVFWDYKENWGFSKRFFQSEVMDSLDDPVQYLYNLLEK